MGIREFTCKECGHHFEVWKVFIKDLPKRPLCPGCGKRRCKIEIIGNLPTAIAFKGEGWTKKGGGVSDVRDIKGMDDPQIAAAMED